MTNALPVVDFDGLQYRTVRLSGASLAQLTRKIGVLCDQHSNAYPVGTRWDALRGVVLAHCGDLAPEFDVNDEGYGNDTRPGSELIPAVLNFPSVHAWLDRITDSAASERRYIGLARPLGGTDAAMHLNSEHINLAAWLLRETGSIPNRPGVVTAPAVLVSKALNPRRGPSWELQPTFDLGPVVADDALLDTMDTLLADGLHSLELREIASRLLA